MHLHPLLAGVGQVAVEIELVVATEHRTDEVGRQRRGVLRRQRELVAGDRAAALTVQVAGSRVRIVRVVDAATTRESELHVIATLGELGVRQGVIEAEGEFFGCGELGFDFKALHLTVALVGRDRGHRTGRRLDRRRQLNRGDIHLEDGDVEHETVIHPSGLHTDFVVDRLFLVEGFVLRTAVGDGDRAVETTGLVTLRVVGIQRQIICGLVVDGHARCGRLPGVVAANGRVVQHGRRSALQVHDRSVIDLALLLFGTAHFSRGRQLVGEVEFDGAEHGIVFDRIHFLRTILTVQAREIDAVLLLLPIEVVHAGRPTEATILR